MEYYGIVFYNEATDDELAFWFQAKDMFEAEAKVAGCAIPGYAKGSPQYLPWVNREFFTHNLDSYFRAS